MALRNDMAVFSDQDLSRLIRQQQYSCTFLFRNLGAGLGANYNA